MDELTSNTLTVAWKNYLNVDLDNFENLIVRDNPDIPGQFFIKTLAFCITCVPARENDHWYIELYQCELITDPPTVVAELMDEVRHVHKSTLMSLCAILENGTTLEDLIEFITTRTVVIPNILPM